MLQTNAQTAQTCRVCQSKDFSTQQAVVDKNPQGTLSLKDSLQERC